MTKQSQTPSDDLSDRSKEFIPFEGDWKAMMMRWNKANLVNFLSLKLKELQAERQRCEGLVDGLRLIKARTEHLVDLDNVSKDCYDLADKTLSASERREADGKELAIHTTKHPYLDSKNDYPDCVYCHPPIKACVHDNDWRWELRDKDSRWLDGKGKKYYPTCPFCPKTQEGKEGL